MSVDPSGGDPNNFSVAASISAEGRYVAFGSFATDLVPGDGNGVQDVYVRDVSSETTTPVSVNTSGGLSGGNSASISADGRYVAFASSATDLVPGDGNGVPDVFVRDLQTDSTSRVSVDTAGGDPNAISFGPSISADGRYVAFRSDASDLVVGDGNGFPDMFVRDLQSGVTTRVSVDTAGGDPNGQSFFDVSMSGDGRYVAFTSEASDLVPGDGNGARDVFVRDLLLSRTIRLSQRMFHGEADGPSVLPSISQDGRYVAFDSEATNLVDGDENGFRDVFVKYARVVTVTGMTPNSLARGATNVTVTINGTGFEPGSTVGLAKPSDEGGDITVSSVNVVSDSEITAVLSVAADAPVGTWGVRVIHPPTALGQDRVAAGQCQCLEIT
ncbi:MAG: TolB family protein [Acidimicrobiia bacterium]